MHKIQRVSFIFRVLFQIIFILLPLLQIFVWIQAPHPLGEHSQFAYHYLNHHLQTLVLHDISVQEKLLGFLISSIPLAVELFIVFFLIKLFKRYEQGEIFSFENVKTIRNIGYTLLVSQLLNPIYEGLMSLLLTWHNPPGHRIAVVSFGTPNLVTIITALLVILISWIMAEAFKLQEEQIYTI
jgi:hypothetical protein